MDTAFACLAGLLLLTGPPAGQGGAAAGGDGAYAQLDYCVVTLVDEAEISAREAGVLRSLEARHGALVDQGMKLAQIDDSDAQAAKRAAELEWEVARAEAENDVDVRAAQAAAEVAAAEVDESEWVNRKQPGAIPETQLRRQRLTRERARLQVEVARMDYRVAGLTADVRGAQVERAQLQIDRREVVSPIDGRVEQVYKHVGEWVNPGDPILRVVRLDRLRIEGFLKASEYSPDEIDGQPVVVTVTLERGRQERFTGKIEFVSEVVEASGEFRVWAEVDNRRTPGAHWLLRPGVEAQMSIQLK